MNAAGAWLGDFAPLPVSQARFWLSLATGYMVLVAALAYVAQRDLRRHRDLLAFLALGKATTALCTLGFYLYATEAFIYFANTVVDGAIALAASAIWLLVPWIVPAGAVEAGSRGTARRLSSDPAFDAFLEAMIPIGGAFEEGAVGRGMAARIEEFVENAGASMAAALLGLVRVLDLSPFFLPPFRWRRFSRLPLEERVALLEAWEGSPFPLRRQALHLLKLLVMVHFYSQPEIRERLGYPDPLERVPRSLQAAP